jgi:phage terminase large subunit
MAGVGRTGLEASAPTLLQMTPGQQAEYLALAAVRIKYRPRIAYPDDPVGFIENVLGAKLWSMQRAIAESVATRRYTFVKKCHSSGGTWLMARLALWWLFAHPDESTVVLTTAPVYRQVEELLWRELRDAWAGATVGLPGRLYAGEPRVNVTNRQYALGFSAGRPEDVPGFHARHVLILKDEAAGIPDDINDALDSAMSGGDTVRTLEMSQPYTATGRFHDAFHRHRGQYAGALFTISAFDTPNFTGEMDAPWLIQTEWEAERRVRWGVDSPSYKVRILGEFPPQGTHQLISPDWCEVVAKKTPAQIGRLGPLVLGVDVGGLGRSESVIKPRAGNWLYPPVVLQHQDPMAVAGYVTQAWRKWHPAAIAVDVTGIGAGAFARLKELDLSPTLLVPVVAGGKAWSDQYSNRGSELYGILRDELRDGVLGGSLDDDEIGDLTQVQAFPESNGRTKVDKYGEGKKKKNAHGEHSPDRGDALAYTGEALAALRQSGGASAEGERV